MQKEVKSMKMRIFSLTALVLLMLSVTAQALEPQATGGNPVLTFSGTTAQCSITCTGNKSTDQVEAKLGELKNILIKYYPAESSNELNSVLFDIFTCEEDLASHNYIEDALFIPAIKKLEQERSKNV